MAAQEETKTFPLEEKLSVLWDVDEHVRLDYQCQP
jgi:hypothetical protein